MRSFGAAVYLLRQARLEIRLIYTAFLALVAFGLCTTAAFQLGEIGPTPARVAAYYRGGEHGADMTFPKTFRQLVEVTHFHSFIMGIVYLVLAHLFVATTVGPRLKLACIGLAFIGLVGDLVGPWLIRYVAPGFAYVQIGCWCFEWIGFAGFIAYPIREMWFSDEAPGLPPE